MTKFSAIPTNASPALVDFLIGVTSGNIDDKISIQTLVNLILKSSLLNNPYKFFVYPTSGSLAPSNKAPFNLKLYDTGSNFDTTNSRFIAPINGFYHLGVNLQMAFAGGQYNQVQFLKNGAAFTQLGFSYFNAGGSWSANGSVTLQMTAGDYIEVYFQGGGSGTIGGLTGGVYLSHFSGFLVSAT